MRRARVRATRQLLLATALLAACSPEAAVPAPGSGAAAAGRPDLLLVLLCTFRYSHMGAAGYERDTTPFLDSLAAEGLFFENAVGASSWTKPAAASLLTGLPADVHGMTDLYRVDDVLSGRVTPSRVLAEEIVTLAEALRGAGYATAARSNNVHVSEHFNMFQGFDDAEAVRHANTAVMVQEMSRWLDGLEPDTPSFFLLMSRDAHVMFDPDYSYYRAFNRVQPPVMARFYGRYYRSVRKQAVETALDDAATVDPELRTRYVDLYDAELAQLDHALSAIPEVLRRSGRAERTLVVVTADHGEHLFEHGMIGHGQRLDETIVRIPLILSGPGIPRGRRDARLVRSIDLYPTLAALAGAALPEGLPGRDLLAETATTADGAADAPSPTTAYAASQQERMLRRGRHALYLRHGGGVELYDLAADPGELRDIGAERPALVAELRGAVEGWQAREAQLRQRFGVGEERELSRDAIEQLRELGYLE